MTGQTDDPQTEERAAAVERIELVVRKEMSGEGTGHDWWHVLRVRRLAERIGETEQCDDTLVSVAALLHDIADWKLNGGDEWAGPRRAQEILDAEPLLKHYGEPVSDIIHSMSFRGARVPDRKGSIELDIVRDADRLDAMGAIGIARAFTFGGAHGELIHDPDATPIAHRSAEDYLTLKSSTINHFREKLLLLRDRMTTQAGREIAHERHRYMEEFVERFLLEWDLGC
ncbi:HD domain-containing protein [Amycolatopsis sp. NPDC049868]|uniref:HD domain-containing protein n=1 Tax=Amycolatopsis sp. NPDC049868 TaxID=3363934 RepID=UPI0037897DDE